MTYPLLHLGLISRSSANMAAAVLACYGNVVDANNKSPSVSNLVSSDIHETPQTIVFSYSIKHAKHSFFIQLWLQDNFTTAIAIRAHISNVAVFNDARWQHNRNAILTKQNVAPCIRIIEG